MTINGKTPENLEEQAISLVGTDIYEKLIKDYTEKQWGKPTTDPPAFIIRRLPVRLTYDNNYFILFENLFKPRQLRLAVLKYSLWLAS